MVCSRLPKRFKLSDFAYAHRGLWGPDGPSENSLEAFLLAGEMGFGIEFDVRPSSDGVPIVFHDPLLDRMTSHKGYVAARTAEDLTAIPLKDCGHVITLEMLLRHWPNQTPLLCELKIDGETDPVSFAKRVGEDLLACEGPVAGMSFSPEAVAALPKKLVKGQLIQPSEISGETNLAESPKTKVDYLACHTSDAGNATLQFARRDMPLITWTVKDAATCEALSSITDSQIFEGFDPALAKRHILNT